MKDRIKLSVYNQNWWRRSGKKKDRMKLSLPPKLVEALMKKRKTG